MSKSWYNNLFFKEKVFFFFFFEKLFKEKVDTITWIQKFNHILFLVSVIEGPLLFKKFPAFLQFWYKKKWK